MEYRIFFLALALLFYQGQSQFCTNSPYFAASQVVAPPLVATTVVDNSVANALANVLQLLVVSDLIESKLGASCIPHACTGVSSVVEGLAPRIPSVVDFISACSTPIEIVAPRVPMIETIAPCYGGITETITPNIFGGYTDTICPNPYSIIETFVPNRCGGFIETVTPNMCGVTDIGFSPYGRVAEIISPPPCVTNVCGLPEVVTPCVSNCFGGVTEFISPGPFNNYGLTEVVVPPSPCRCGCGFSEVITPNYCNPYGAVEVMGPVSPFGCGCAVVDVITPKPFNSYNGIAEFVGSPCNPGCGCTEIITPYPYMQNCGGFPEVIAPLPSCNRLAEVIPSFGPYCGGVTELMSPCNSVVELIAPGPYSPFYGGITEFVAPCNPGCLPAVDVIAPNPFPNCYGGVREVISPARAEIIYPPPSPANLPCNVGFMPTSVPFTSINVEPFETFGFGNCYYY